MTKLQTLLSIAAIFCAGTAAQAQSCSKGSCSFEQQPGDGYTGTGNGDQYGSSQFQTPASYDGVTSSFSQACKECGSAHGPNFHGGNTAQSGVTQRYTSPQDRYAPIQSQYAPAQSQYAPTSGYRDYAPHIRDGYSGTYRPQPNDRTRDYDRGFTADRFNDRYNDRTNDRNFGTYRPRTNSNPSLQYQPLPGATRGGYGFTDAPYNNARMIPWQTNLQQAARQAQQARRPMMVTVTANWCGYCTRMKNETFRDARVIGQLNTAGFVPVNLDSDANAQLVSRLGIRSLPTTLIVGSDMKILERLDGFRTADQLGLSLRRHSRSADAGSKIKVAQR